DGTTSATITGCTLTGVLAGDAANVSCAAAGGTFATAAAGNGKTVTATGIALSGSALGHYTLNGVTTATALANITPLTVTAAVTADNKPYDGTTSPTSTGCRLTGVLAGDTANVS